MQPLPTLPGVVVDEGARRLALGHLEDAGRARARIASASDAEALHDYRVALRRLRSCLRAYRKHVRSTVATRTLRLLRRVARATGESRDLDVHLAWLREQRERVAVTEWDGVSSMLERLSVAKHRAWDDMLREDEAYYPKMHARLIAALTKFRATIRLDARFRRRATATVTARRVRSASGRLQRQLGRVGGYTSAGAIHRARIAAKHLRYLLEPFAAAVADGDEVVARLRALQDALGDVHDAHVFIVELRDALAGTEARDPAAAGLKALIAALEARGARAFAGAARDWLGGRGGAFFRKVDEAADAIAELADRDQEVTSTALPSRPRRRSRPSQG